MYGRLDKVIRPQLLAAFGLFSSTPHARTQSSFIVRSPSPYAPREVPTPLVFLSAQRWQEDSGTGFTKMSAMYAERGYTCIQIDLAPPDNRVDSVGLMTHFEKELASHIRLAAIPFPPVLFARSAGCLIAQTYIESNPASGLLLLSPPTSTSDVPSDLLSSPLPEFTYEPNFPLAIVENAQAAEKQKRENRLIRDHDVELIIVPNLEGQEAFAKIEKWMDHYW